MNHIVGIADMKISANAEDTITTYALGSCLAITVYDPVVRVGGMLHIMLPSSAIHSEKPVLNPYTFVDTGVPRLFIECYKAGVQRERVIVKVAGGASITTPDENDYFHIGESNFVVLRRLLWKNGIRMNAHDVGGSYCRTMCLSLADGDVTITTEGKQVAL